MRPHFKHITTVLNPYSLCQKKEESSDYRDVSPDNLHLNNPFFDICLLHKISNIHGQLNSRINPYPMDLLGPNRSNQHSLRDSDRRIGFWSLSLLDEYTPMEFQKLISKPITVQNHIRFQNSQTITPDHLSV